MSTKKFKTVSGYLRSNEYSLEQRTYKLEGDERVAAVKKGQREILNNLLPQLDGLPKLDNNIDPIEGIEQLLATGGTDRQVKALKDCRRWLKNYRIITITVIPQVKTEQGLVSYRVDGFKRSERGSRAIVIVDADPNSGIMEGRPHQIAGALAGPDYCFHSSQNISCLVPDAAKNRLFTSEEELYAAAPELDPKRRGITSSTIYRGYEIKKASGKHVISKENAVVSEQPTKEAALRWVDTEKDAEWRSKRQHSEGGAS